MTAYLMARGDAGRLPFRDEEFNCVFGSPPYRKARLYLEDGRDLGVARDTEDWIAWMLGVTAEALRVCRGPVVWVAAGSTEDRNYHPICEGLMYRWWQMGGHAYRPCYWHRSGIPGSGGDDWFRADVEYVMCFKRPGKLPWSDPTAMGHPPKWAPGGEMSHRVTDGNRVNAFGMRQEGIRIGARRPNGRTAKTEFPPSKVRHTKRSANVPLADQSYSPPVLANPGNLVTVKVGGGHLGSDHAHSNEAPFPEMLAEHFIRSLCPPGGLVLDPFSGSGTTASVAIRLGRRGIGLDLRQSQCLLGRRRIEHPHAPVARTPRADEADLPLFAAREGDAP